MSFALLSSVHKMARNRTMLFLLFIILFALVMRLINLDSDLWLDEVASVRRFAGGSPVMILTTYQTTNNHLLNSFFISAVTSTLGSDEWMLRAPAVVFGGLAVAAIFWLARRYFTPSISLLAALALAVAYQHIFFSQSVRGYSAYFLFAIISSAALARITDPAATRGRTLWMIGYIIAAWLGVMSHLTMAFIIAGHGVVALAALIMHARRGARLIPMITRLIVVYAAVGVVCLVTFAGIIPQALALLNNVYQVDQAAGYQALSLEFFQELLRTLSGNLSPLLLVVSIPAGIIGLFGALSLIRRDGVLLFALCVGPVLHFTLSAVRELVFSPRFLLVLLIPFILISLEVIRLIVQWLEHRVKATTPVSPLIWVIGVAAMLGALAFPLSTYYAFPKQPYTATIAHIETIRTTDQLVIAIDSTEQGFRYYGGSLGDNLVYVRTVEAFDQALALAGTRGAILVTSLERNLRVDVPDLYARIQADWQIESRFHASVGDGDLRVYTQITQ